MTERHYYRCVDCLTVAAADGPELGKAACGLCAGRIEHMGRVVADRLVKTGMGCPCDGRCTGARGPKCDCHCGGEFHGSGMLVPIVRDCGPVPVLKMAASGKSLRIAAEWRWGKAALEEAIVEAAEQFAATNLGNDARRRLSRLYAAKERARETYRNHKHRMAAIREALPDWQPTERRELQAALF